MLCQQNVNVKIQQELMRHANIAMTMDVYTQAVPEELRKGNTKVIRMVLGSTERMEA